MKTGFICASGFNVVASATRNGRKLIVVVFGSRSGMVRSEKAAQLFEKGFNSGGLSWLMPSLGSVDALQPIAAAPPNLREEMCGRHRRRPAAEEADEEDELAASSDVDQSSAYAVTMQSLRGRVARGPILGPYAMISPPIPVFVGTGRKADEPVQIARRKGKGKKPETAIAAAPPPAATAAKPEEAKPATVNASVGFSLTPLLNKLGTASFTPASAESKPAPAPEAAKPEADKKKTAAKPAEKKPAAKPNPRAKTAARKPDAKRAKQ